MTAAVRLAKLEAVAEAARRHRASAGESADEICGICAAVAALDETGPPPAPAWPGGNRRACTCGAGLIADGMDATGAALLAGFEAAHTGPGHGSSRRPPSKDGRA